ncbi:unnamed protein product [Rhizoctonia solani]|uniref:Protein kinase domain-containing protein n=1 Tax=Rhizoctonia solani TaxID=456999 RepID=A0A8H3B9T5_9AGAM|nr:unnamed protein product [Rhizoctonia solani]
MHEGDDLPELEGKGVVHVHSALNIYNVLVKDSGRAVISGFGHAKVIKDFQESFTGDNSEYQYMALEILDDAVLTFGSDIWSWAMTSLEILMDEPPFGAKTRGTRIIQMIGANKRPERANHPKIETYDNSDEIWQLFEDCWEKQPEDRPSASEVVRRVRPFVQLGKRNHAIDQKPPPTQPRTTEYGRSYPAVKEGTRPLPGHGHLWKATQPVSIGQPPNTGTGGTGGTGPFAQGDSVAQKPPLPPTWLTADQPTHKVTNETVNYAPYVLISILPEISLSQKS